MKNKEKILIAHNYYQVPGGEDTVVANEKQLLERHGHKVVLYTRHNAELQKMGVFQKLMLPLATIFNIKTYKETRKLIKREKINIVHVHNTLPLISPAVYYAALSCKVPVVQTVHNFRLLCPGATFYRDGHICEDCVTQGLKCAVRHSCYRGNRVGTLACVLLMKIHRFLGIYRELNYICLTQFNKDKLLMLNRPGKKPVFRLHMMYVKPHFVEPAPTEPIPFEMRKNQLVYAGRLDKLKGIRSLLKAWSYTSTGEPELLVCGTGSDVSWCRDYLEEHKEKNIQILGFVPNEKIRGVIAESKAVILPTQLFEGFPMSIVEAFSVGTPVIGPDFGNTGNLIQNGVTGFKYGQDLSLTEAIRRACRKDMVFSVYRHYIQNYTPASNYSCLIDIYSKVRNNQ